MIGPAKTRLFKIKGLTIHVDLFTKRSLFAEIQMNEAEKD
jgi:hypothetical protein